MTYRNFFTAVHVVSKKRLLGEWMWTQLQLDELAVGALGPFDVPHGELPGRASTGVESTSPYPRTNTWKFAGGRSGSTYRPPSSVVTILMSRVGKSVVSATTQTPASGPFDLVTTPPMSSASIATVVVPCWASSPTNNPASATATTNIEDRKAISDLIFHSGAYPNLMPRMAGDGGLEPSSLGVGCERPMERPCPRQTVARQQQTSGAPNKSASYVYCMRRTITLTKVQLTDVQDIGLESRRDTSCGHQVWRSTST